MVIVGSVAVVVLVGSGAAVDVVDVVEVVEVVDVVDVGGDDPG